jgi:nitrite reductase/ring-hydroxylating ferredoxin subunit
MSEMVAKLENILDGGSIRRQIQGREVAIFRKGDEVFAIDAICPHRGGPLDAEKLHDGYITMCPFHGWEFDVRTGKSVDHPGRVMSHKVEVKNGEIFVTLDLV